MENVHLVIQSQNFRAWSMAINSGTADLEICPHGHNLAKTLRPAKHNVRHPLREPEAVKSTPGTPATPINTGFMNPFFNLPRPFYPPPFPYYPTPPAYTPPSYDQSTRNKGKCVPSSPPEALRSSPIPEAEIAGDKLAKYISWLKTLHPARLEKLQECLEVLELQDVVFQNIPDITDELFDKWDITHGMRLILRSNHKKYDKAVAKGLVPGL